MRIALVQAHQNGLYHFNEPQKRLPAERAHALRDEMIRQTLDQMEAIPAADLIVTTEAVNFPGIHADLSDLPGLEGELVASFARQARRAGAYLVAGLYTCQDGLPYNSALVFDRVGKLTAVYNKTHLVGDEQRRLTPGDGFCTVRADFGTFGVCVCWDMQFPEVCRALMLSGARLVACPTWGWEGIYAHARAYENGIFVAGAMAVPSWMPIQGLRNPSEVVAPDGRILAAGPRDRCGVVLADVDLRESESYAALRLHDRRPDLYGLLCEK